MGYAKLIASVTATATAVTALRPLMTKLGFNPDGAFEELKHFKDNLDDARKDGKTGSDAWFSAMSETASDALEAFTEETDSTEANKDTSSGAKEVSEGTQDYVDSMTNGEAPVESESTADKSKDDKSKDDKSKGTVTQEQAVADAAELTSSIVGTDVSDNREMGS